MVCVYRVRWVLILHSLLYHCEAFQLRKIITETCADAFSFTHDRIYLELYNGKSDHCKATFPWLQWTTRDKKQVKISEGSALGDCQGFEYVSSNALRGRVVWDHGWGTGNWFQPGYDAVQLCSVILEFGDRHKTNEVFIWKGKKWFKGDSQFFMEFYNQKFYLDRISATVCNEVWSGTNDMVHLELTDGYMTCTTDFHDSWGNNWVDGMTENLTDKAIESCRFLDANADKLRVRVVILPFTDLAKSMFDIIATKEVKNSASWGWQLAELGEIRNKTFYDQIQLCNLEAEFKSYKTDETKSFYWKGAQWWKGKRKTYVSLSENPLDHDKVIAPNSYFAKMLISEDDLKPKDLEKDSKIFDALSPQMFFSGVNPADPPTIISWSDLKNGHEDGEFHSFVNRTLSKVLRNAKKLVLVTHGFGNNDVEHCPNMWVSVLANKIGTFENEEPKSKQQVPTTTVAICWNSFPTVSSPYTLFTSSLSMPSLPGILHPAKICFLANQKALGYFQNACSTGKMGELLAKLIKAIKDVFANIEYVHGIGHSLGAHVMGNIYNFGGIKLDRISGLDPAGPCFEGSSQEIRIVGREWGVTRNSAYFVDNIHTDIAFFGTSQSKGHLDFFTGDPDQSKWEGAVQPTCKDSHITFNGMKITYPAPCMGGCCHNLAIEYYKESINIDEFPRFKTSYLTKSQDETSRSGRTIGLAESSQVYFAGYHASTSSSNPSQPRKNRMYLPIFKVNDMWHPICDPKIDRKNKHWCDNQE